MPSFMTTQWTPKLDTTTGRVTGFSASARGYDAKPGAAVEMSDRTYRVATDGTIRRGDPAHTGLRKKERVSRRRKGAGAESAASARGVARKLSKRERAAIQSAQEIERRAGLVDE